MISASLLASRFLEFLEFLPRLPFSMDYKLGGRMAPLLLKLLLVVVFYHSNRNSTGTGIKLNPNKC